MQVQGTSYRSSKSLGSSPVYQSGSIFHATIGPLSPESTYYYQVGSDTVPECASELFEFRTPPAVGKFPIRLALVGDLGTELG